jgi:hypothetical protein
MIVILAIDALEYNLVERFNCAHLKQNYYGKTDISEFSEPRTMVLWSSFMTGKNLEAEILEKGDKEMWNTHVDHARTFFSRITRPAVIDLPGYNYDLKEHERERDLLKQYFDAGNPDEKEQVKKEYNDRAFEFHRKMKNEFISAIGQDHDLVLGYFSIADVIGHLNFSNTTLMRMIYKDLDDIAGAIPAQYLVLSDHGMEPLGSFGDHSRYGFWSSSDQDLGLPKITDFPKIVTEFIRRQNISPEPQPD